MTDENFGHFFKGKREREGEREMKGWEGWRVENEWDEKERETNTEKSEVIWRNDWSSKKYDCIPHKFVVKNGKFFALDGPFDYTYS